jgi:hypothetical protein
MKKKRRRRRRKEKKRQCKVLLKTEKWLNSKRLCVEEWESETSERETDGIQGGESVSV